MSSVNRGWLKRQIEAGRVVLTSGYHFDDAYGESRSEGMQMPVRMRPDDGGTFVEGVCQIYAHELKSKSGCAYRSDGGDRITLIVHSNRSYVFRILTDAELAEQGKEVHAQERTQQP